MQQIRLLMALCLVVGCNFKYDNEEYLLQGAWTLRQVEYPYEVPNDTLTADHGVGSTDHFSALKIWMFENKFVSLPSHLKTIEPMEVHRGQELCVIQKLQK